MAKNKANYEEHSFFCMNCGSKGIPLPRKKGHQHAAFHRKKLYCLSCKTEINHIECRTPVEIETFKTNFEKGVYVNEVKDSMAYLGSSCIR